jgi:hypothetical protein
LIIAAYTKRTNELTEHNACNTVHTIFGVGLLSVPTEHSPQT